MAMGIDFASSSFWNEEKQLYDYARQGMKRDHGEQIEFVNSLYRTISWSMPKIRCMRAILKVWQF